MSGPKVVRIVTREELVATCNALLAQLDDAIRAWSRDGQRLEQLDASEIGAASKRRAELAELLKQDKFLELQKHVPQETAFFRQRRQELLERAARAAAMARERASRQRQNAMTLLAELQRRAPGQHAELTATLNSIAHGSTPDAYAEATLAAGFRLLSSAPAELAVTEVQRRLAQQLAPKEDAKAYEAWSQMRQAAADKRLSQLQQHLGFIETHRGDAEVSAFSRRLIDLENEPESPARSLKVDALVLDVAAEVQSLQKTGALAEKARSLLAEIDAAREADRLSAQRTELSRALEDHEVTDALIDSSRAALQELLQRDAAQARREAVLAGLAALGYEVSEGMSTAWAEQGRVVLRKPSLDGYGIELAGAPDAQRMQVRTVAFSASRDNKRDRDAETLWCGDFTKLRSIVAKQSSSLELEKALPIGAVPLKVVGIPAEAVRAEPKARVDRAM